MRGGKVETKTMPRVREQEKCHWRHTFLRSSLLPKNIRHKTPPEQITKKSSNKNEQTALLLSVPTKA